MYYVTICLCLLHLQESHIHLVKMTRLLRLARLLQKMDRYSQYTAMILTLLMLSFSLVAHWLACIWYVIAEKEKNLHDIDWDIGKYLINKLSNETVIRNLNRQKFFVINHFNNVLVFVNNIQYWIESNYKM